MVNCDRHSKFDRKKQRSEAIKAQAAKLPFIPRQVYGRAQQEGFIVTFGKSFEEAYQLYRHWCEYASRPFISVQRHSNDAEIALDMTTVPRQLPEDVQSEIHDLLSDTAVDGPNANISISPTAARSSVVDLDRVKEVAARLYELVTDSASRQDTRDFQKKIRGFW